MGDSKVKTHGSEKQFGAGKNVIEKEDGRNAFNKHSLF